MVKPSLPLELTLAHLERAINQALAYSLEWPEYSSKLNKTWLRCELSPLGLEIFVHIHAGAVSLTTQGPEQVDLMIRATPSGLLEMAQHKRAGSKIGISGNAHLAQTLQQAMSHLTVDWEGLLAEHLGDLAARQTSEIFIKVKDFATRFVSTVLADTSDYLVDEKKLLASQTEVDAFYQAVTTLRYDADRLEARIRRLEN